VCVYVNLGNLMNVHDSSGRALQRCIKSSPDPQAGETNGEVFFLSTFFSIFIYRNLFLYPHPPPGQHNGSIAFDKTTVIYTSHVREVP